MSTPSQTAKRPRYSLVWKLVFHPKHSSVSSTADQSGDSLRITKPEWGEVTKFGSANKLNSCQSPGQVMSDSSTTTSSPPGQQQRERGDNTAIVEETDVEPSNQHRNNFGSASFQCLLEFGPVEIKSAGAKGMGAFALQPIKAGTCLGAYKGEVLTQADLDERYPVGVRTEYVFEAGPGVYVDARDPHLSSWHRYVNHSGEACNVEVAPDGKPRL